MTDYEWEIRERAKQKERFFVFRKSKNIHTLPEDPSNLGYDFIENDENDRLKKFIFMTTASIPIYDKRENAVSIILVLLIKRINYNYKRKSFDKFIKRRKFKLDAKLLKKLIKSLLIKITNTKNLSNINKLLTN